MPINRSIVDQASFNPLASLPYELRIRDFESAMQDVYDFVEDSRRNPRGELGTLDRHGIKNLRQNWLYMI